MRRSGEPRAQARQYGRDSVQYRWLGKPRREYSCRAAGGLGFLLHGSLFESGSALEGTGTQEVQWWLRVGGSNDEATPLMLASVYMPCNPVSRPARDACDTAFDLLQADVVRSQQDGTIVLLGDVNGRVGLAQDLTLALNGTGGGCRWMPTDEGNEGVSAWERARAGWELTRLKHSY